MTITTLELYHFRNYEKQVIGLNDSINILYGENAQGKTNILEALYITATGKSHRTNSYHDLIQYGQTGFELKLTACIQGRENNIVIRYSKEKGRIAEINGIKRDRISDILGTLNMILFSPETLEVVKGSPNIRRKFIDILLCQTNRHYLYLLQQYNVLIKNKSHALKRGKYDNKYEGVLPVWNEQLAELGGKISFLRMKTIESLNQYMKNEIIQITEDKETSELVYKTFSPFKADSDEKYFEKELSKKLKQGLQKELQIAQCLYGPHRDDFEILLNGMNSRQYCSQGQQRTLALSLIIAELLFVEEIRGEKPVLLLDDVMSELDLKRQEHLIKGLYDVQTIITTTDDLPFESIKNRQVMRYFIKNGSISPKS